MPEARLQKALADAGVASRRRAEELISDGRVTVDGQAARLGMRVDPQVARIEVDGRAIATGRSPRVYLALHKPAGVTSTVSDPHASRTVLDLVPQSTLRAAGRLYPVGRLDRDSEGLLLLTNDGPWAQRVLHPGYRTEREYAVATAGLLSPDRLGVLRRGIDLEEGHATFVDLRPASRSETASLLRLIPIAEPDLAWYRVTLEQGWKRQIRRMFAAIEAPVVRLVRVRIGSLGLGDLETGALRVLTAQEAARLAGGSPAQQATRPSEELIAPDASRPAVDAPPRGTLTRARGTATGMSRRSGG